MSKTKGIVDYRNIWYPTPVLLVDWMKETDDREFMNEFLAEQGVLEEDQY